MNKAYDYNGTIISPSKSTAKLTTLRRVVHLDSGDRDKNQYPTNGDMVLYLPRTYEKVVGIRVKGAEFPPIQGSYYIHDYGSTGVTGTNDLALTVYPYSVFLDIENLNSADSAAFQAEKSLKDLEDKISEEQKNDITESLESLKEAIKNKNVEESKRLMEEVTGKFQKVSQEIYESTKDDITNNNEEFNDVDFEEVQK